MIGALHLSFWQCNSRTAPLPPSVHTTAPTPSCPTPINLLCLAACTTTCHDLAGYSTGAKRVCHVGLL
jgi:hypothetical protein